MRAGFCCGMGAIGTTPHGPMLRRSAASIDSGNVAVGGVSSHAAAKRSTAAHSGLTPIVMTDLLASSMERQRQRDLMSRGFDVDETQRPAGGRESGARGPGIGP